MKKQTLLLLSLAALASCSLYAATSDTGVGAASTASACTDGRMTAQAVDQIPDGARIDEVSAALGCQPASTTSITDPMGRSQQQASWQATSTSVVATFVNGFLASKKRYANFDYGPAVFDAATNVLTIPVLVAGGTTYQQASVSLPPSGAWALTAIKDAQGNALQVVVTTAPTNLGGTRIAAGVVLSFSGIVPGGLFMLDDNSVWLAGADCNMAFTAGTSPVSPRATIYFFSGASHLSLQGYPASCGVAKVLP